VGFFQEKVVNIRKNSKRDSLTNVVISDTVVFVLNWKYLSLWEGLFADRKLTKTSILGGAV
jgi:hypothetical protein